MRSVYVLTLSLAVGVSACANGEAHPPGADASATQDAPPELRALVDSLLPDIETLSGLQSRAPLSMAMQSRGAVRAFVEAQLDEEMPPEILGGIAATYAALGLMPDTLDLRALLLDLYTEQVVGYYDPESKQLYVVEGADENALTPILAHELVHALQDQYTNLDSLIARERGNDRQAAAQAAMEGQATLVTFSFLAEAMTGRRTEPEDLPDPAMLRSTLEAQNSQFPVFQRAPLIIRETLLFPYLGGAGFVHTLWNARAGRPAPLDSLLPQSTEQIMHPRAAFLDVRDEPTELRFTEPGAWRVLYENTLGELETGIWLQQHAGPAAARAAAGWDGDRIRLLEGPGGVRALVWHSIWDDARAADAFAAAAQRIMTQRTDRRGRVVREELGGRSVVRIVDAGMDVVLDSVPNTMIIADGG